MHTDLNTRFAKWILFVITFAFLSFNAFNVSAQCRLLNENFNSNPVLSTTNVDGTWYPDRFRPAGFSSAVLSGSNVLKISIDGINDGSANRPPGYSSSFYNTQGRKFNQCGGCVTVMKGKLWIPADWATSHRRSDMWATAYDNSNSITTWPIIGFRNVDGLTPGIYYWDGNVGWINSGVTITYDSWYQMEFRLVGPNIEYLVNNVVVGSIFSDGSAYFGDIIMQAFNFNDPALAASQQSTDSYDAYWDDLITTGTGGNVVTNLNTGQTFCSIQGAIDAPLTLNGHTISVSAGVYAENVIVNKSVSIEGPNASINACSGSRVAEAIVVPASAAISSGEIFHVAASNVSIKGLTIDGDNTAITSGYTSTNGADIDAAEGITVYETGVNGLTVANNIIRNLSYFGVTLYDFPAAVPSSGHLITGNKIQDMGTYDAGSGINLWGGGVLLYNNQYAAVTNNCIENVRIGVQTGNFHLANPGGSGSQVIANNTISARRRGIFHNLFYSSASGYTLSGNTITAITDPHETYWDGMLISSMSVPSTCTGNTINGTGAPANSTGYMVWNVKNTYPTAISGGSVSNVKNGVFANNYDGYPSTGSDATDGASVQLSGMAISDCQTGIRVRDNLLSTHAAVNLSIGAGVTVSNGTDGLVVENGAANVSSLNNLAFSGQSGKYIWLLNNSNNLDATAVGFDGQTGVTANPAQHFAIEDKIVHKIDNYGLGFVLVKTNNNYVTVNSFDAPFTNDAQIQRGIDAAANGFTVNVQAGNYAKQIAVNRSVFGANGPHQFGLFIDKNNLTVRGYDASNNAVANAGAAAVVFNTGATNNFGSSGIFVQGNNVTIEGLKQGDNYDNSNVRDNNKSIEVVGDGFTMNKCWLSTATDEGALYMGRWDATHPVNSYTISNNRFENSLISINNGVGLAGPRSGRQITGNEFTGVATPYLIGFRGWNGASPVQGWIVDPVGGAVVTGNTFNTTGVDKYIVARGNAGGYDNNQLNWQEMWTSNTFGNHVVTLTDYPSFDVRSYTDAAGYTETRRISPLIQENANIGLANDVVLVSSGTYNESPDLNITTPVVLRGANYNVSCTGARGAESIIQGTAGVSGSKAITISSNGVSVNGFTIKNPLGSMGVYANGRSDINISYNIITDIGNAVTGSGASYGAVVEPSSAAIANLVMTNNCVNNIRGGQNGCPGATNGSGVGLGIGFSTSNYDISNSLISNNIIQNITACNFNGSGGKGAYGVLVNIGAGSGTGKANGLTISDNDIAHLYGRWSHGIGLEGETPGAMVLNNAVDDLTSATTDAIGVQIEDNAGASTVEIHLNSLTNLSKAVNNLMVPVVNATCNWYGSNVSATVSGKVAGNVTYIPYLSSGTDANTSQPGFQTNESCSTCSITAGITNNTGTTIISCDNPVISVTATGGSIYSWTGGSSPNTAANTFSAPGTYTVTVTQPNGCSATASITLTYVLYGDIFNASTNCTDYRNCSSGRRLGQLCYTAKSGKVTNVTIGQFSYIAEITVPSTTLTVDVVQARSLPTFKLFTAQQNTQIAIYDQNCVKLNATVTNPSTGQYRIVVANATVGAKYVVTAKYDAKSVLNSTYSAPPPTVTYTFSCKVNTVLAANTETSINLVPNCSGNTTTTAREMNETEMISTDLVSSVLPNPSADQFRLLVNSGSADHITVRIIDEVGRTWKQLFVKAGQPVYFGAELPKGVYLVEVRQGERKTLNKVVKF